MANTVIKVENVGKKYIIGHLGKHGYKTFREQMIQHVQNFYSRTRQMITGKQVLEGDEVEEFWALKDLNFELTQGDRIGIIGRNGAGKSTLLKVLSRITEPTTGRISIKGRVASLLEVGTGFHPELTGRENIFLNGAIMGMSRGEIKRKFDEIVDFSGVEKFLDTPVKRYSSGMYVRLAFSVAAHLEPEILVVDEVLAVGDAEFQKKCLGKMQDVSTSEGRTVLFVSHNMLAIQTLCNKGIVLNKGQMVYNESSSGAINFYQSHAVALPKDNLAKRKDRMGGGAIRFTSAWAETSMQEARETFFSGDNIRVVAEYHSTDTALTQLSSLQIAFAITGPYGEQLADLTNVSSGNNWTNVPSKGKVICKLPAIPLNAGMYRFNICARVNNVIEDLFLMQDIL
jgi:lipopolysaccharide transport system ATP-binding protein